MTVNEVSAPVVVSTQQSSGLVGEREVKNLPLNGRSFDELLALNPTIVNFTSERSGGVGTSNHRLATCSPCRAIVRKTISSY